MDDYGGLRTRRWEFDSLRTGQTNGDIMNLIEKFNAKKLLDEVPEDKRYYNSPFRKLRLIPSVKAKGTRYEELCQIVYETYGKVVERAPKKVKDFDRNVDGVRVEIKGASLVNGTNNFIFNQIRPNQQYDVIHFACFYPLKIVILELTKNEIIDLINNNQMRGQHGGKNVDSGTYSWSKSESELLNLGARIIYNEEFDPVEW